MAGKRRPPAVPGIRTIYSFIRDYIKRHGPSSPYDIWKAYVAYMKSLGYSKNQVASYQAFSRYIWLLTKGVQKGVLLEAAKNNAVRRAIIMVGRKEGNRWALPPFIIPVARAPSSRGKPKTLYTTNPEIPDVLWEANIQALIYPRTRLGKRRYERRVQGVPPKRLRGRPRKGEII